MRTNANAVWGLVVTALVFCLGLAGLMVAAGHFAPEGVAAAEEWTRSLIVQVEEDTAWLVWRSRSALPCVVEFGDREQDLRQTVSARQGRDGRCIAELSGLDTGTRYYFRIRAGEVVMEVQSFQTPPSAFHVKPYLQHPTPHAITVMWETTTPLPGHVEFGETPALGRTVARPAPIKLHEVRLEGLKPATRYYYRVLAGGQPSPVFSFRTPPALGTHRWKLAVYGDSRTFPFVHRKVVEQILKHDVDLVLHTGDMVDSGKVYEQWRRQFFAPIAPLAATVPYLTALGNHEGNAKHYFDYFSHPGNERYFAFPFANARLICLDSNSWIARGRESEQYKWLEEELKRPTDAAWTFVAFHHPLFSAHATREINSLRWDWAPLLCEAGSPVDAILTGHDHFYARSFPISTITGQPVRGVPSYTTAGGGAWPYKCEEKDYIAFARTIYHFTLMEFDADRVTVSVISHTGEVLDKHLLTKDATPPAQLCAYEIEELKYRLTRAINARRITLEPDKPTHINTVLQAPHLFRIPLRASLSWTPAPGWQVLSPDGPVELRPNEPLVIPLRAKVQPGADKELPKLRIEFEPGLFRNRVIEVQPFRLR